MAVIEGRMGSKYIFVKYENFEIMITQCDNDILREKKTSTKFLKHHDKLGFVVTTKMCFYEFLSVQLMKWDNYGFNASQHMLVQLEHVSDGHP